MPVDGDRRIRKRNVSGQQEQEYVFCTRTAACLSKYVYQFFAFVGFGLGFCAFLSPMTTVLLLAYKFVLAQFFPLDASTRGSRGGGGALVWWWTST